VCRRWGAGDDGGGLHWRPLTSTRAQRLRGNPLAGKTDPGGGGQGRACPSPRRRNHSSSKVSHSPTQATHLRDMMCDHHPPLPGAPTCGRRVPKRIHPCLDRHNRRSKPSAHDLTARDPALCENGRDDGDHHAFIADTTPRVRTQNGHLPQGPQRAILTNYLGATT